MFCTKKKKERKNFKDRSFILGSIKIAEQVETLSLQKEKKKLLRIEASSSVRSKSPSRWKPYRYKKKKNSKDRSLILGSIKIAKQVETLSLQKEKNSKDRSLILGSIKIAEQVETLSLQKEK